MPTLEQILADTQNYPDNLTVKIQDTDVPLGSLRGVNKSERDRIAAETQSLNTDKQNLSKQQQEVLRLAAEAQRIHGELEQRAAAPAGRTESSGFDDDPFWEPPRKVLKSLQEKYDKAIEKLNAASERYENQTKNQATIWADREWDREYESILSSLPEEKRSKVPKRDDILKFALENTVVDRHKIPSVKLAYQKMTEADRVADAAAIARQEGIEEGRRISMAGRVPQPSGVRPNAGPAQLDDWNQLTDVALADPQIRKLVEQMESGRGA